MSEQTIGPLDAVRAFFGTPEKPVTVEEIRALGSVGVKELAPDCARALGKTYQEPIRSK